MVWSSLVVLAHCGLCWPGVMDRERVMKCAKGLCGLCCGVRCPLSLFVAYSWCVCRSYCCLVFYDGVLIRDHKDKRSLYEKLMNI